eukprot:s3488_g8.t1
MIALSLKPGHCSFADSEAMSLLAAARRAPRATNAFRVARRNLGDGVAGPGMSDFGANAKLAMSFFTKPAMSYPEFKQQCVSLRHRFEYLLLNGYLILRFVIESKPVRVGSCSGGLGKKWA